MIDDDGKPSKLRLGTGEQTPVDPEVLADALRVNRELAERIVQGTRDLDIAT